MTEGFLNQNCVVLVISSTPCPWLASPAAPSSTMGTRHSHAAADADTAASSASPAPAPRAHRPGRRRRGLRAWGRSIKRRVRGCFGLEPAPSIHPAVAPATGTSNTGVGCEFLSSFLKNLDQSETSGRWIADEVGKLENTRDVLKLEVGLVTKGSSSVFAPLAWKKYFLILLATY